MTCIIRIPLLCVLLQVPASLGVGCGGLEGSLPCGSSPLSGCYSKSQRCDGAYDCSNGADEYNCSGHTRTKVTQGFAGVAISPHPTNSPALHKRSGASSGGHSATQPGRNSGSPNSDEINLEDYKDHNNESPRQSLNHNVNIAKYNKSQNSTILSQSGDSHKTKDVPAHPVHESRGQTGDKEKNVPAHPVHESRANLGWLITPIIFGIACVYGLYRCITDGICKCRRFRRLSGQAISFMYLNGISFYGFTRTHLGGSGTGSTEVRQQLVDQESVSLSVPAGSTDTASPRSYEQPLNSHSNGCISQQELLSNDDQTQALATATMTSEDNTASNS